MPTSASSRMIADDASDNGSCPVTQPIRREPMRKTTSRSTVTSQRQLIARPLGSLGSCQTMA